MSSTRSDRCQRGVAAVLEPSGNIARASSTGTGATVAAVIAAVVSVVSNGYGADLASSPLRTDADSCRHISADVAAGVGGQALRAAVQRTVVGGSTAISSTARTWCRLSPTSESYRNRSPGSVTS